LGDARLTSFVHEIGRLLELQLTGEAKSNPT
jgi:hypothetical protein